MDIDKKNTSAYLKFDKSRMVNLEYSLEREILRTNRRGAYHCTTLVECNTRKQHGLLVMPIQALGNTNHVLLSSFDETIIQHGAEFNLGIHKYDGDNYSPMGHKYIREFDCDSLPRTIYRIGGIILSKEKMFSLFNNTFLIRYHLLDSHSPTTIRFRPFLAFREINQLTYENITADLGYKEIENGISIRMYSGYPELNMQFSKEAQFIFKPSWYKGIEYKKDMEEGFPYKEDLYVPGYFELPIQKGETVVFAATSETPSDTSKFSLRFEEGIKKRTPRSSLYNCMKNSGHQFYVRPSENELYILDKYPWGEINARDQFLSLPGLTLFINKPEAFEEVMNTAIPIIANFLEGKSDSSKLKHIEYPDVLFWMVWSLKKYTEYNQKNFLDRYAFIIDKIISFILSNKHPHLKITDNKLLFTDANKVSTSWMSTTPEGRTVVYRSGYLVEINAFWYNTLMFNAEILQSQKNTKQSKEMSKLAEQVKKSFNEIFVNNAGYLYDYVDGGFVDWSVRPNMLLAISVDYPLVDKHVTKSVLDIVTKELLTPKGIRSLSPKSNGFSPRYEGSRVAKEYSAANGGAYPWLLGFYMNSYLRIFQRSGIAFLDRLLIGIEEEMANDCIGSLSEVYDGSLPYKGHGAVSSAINVAGVLYALKIQQSFEEEY